MITLKRLEQICQSFAGKKLLIYGDIILDRYIFGQVDRISPEAPVPVVKVTHEELRLGGAGNVAANIDSLGATGVLMGIVGDDIFADYILQMKKKNHIVIQEKNVHTIVKTRVLTQRQQIVRIDREDIIATTPAIDKQLLDAVAKTRFDGIIVSDYAKGTVNRTVIKALIQLAQAKKIPIVVDPKPPHFDMYRGVTGVTPNLSEAEAMVGKKIASDKEVAAAIARIRKKYHTRFAVITRSAKGISVGEFGKRVFHFPAHSLEVFDVTGAGDTVAAVLTLALSSGASLREAVVIANAAASIVVEKIGTSQVNASDLIERFKHLRRTH
jgi:D-glycero-beta-D-manno-heptose-7-phosphate kinase